MQIDNKRMEQILDAFAKEAAKHLKAEDIISEKPWINCFSGLEASFVAKVIETGRITKEEFGYLVKPHIGTCIAKALGAKEVIIKW